VRILVRKAGNEAFHRSPCLRESFYTSCVRSLFKLAVESARQNWSSSLATVSYADIVEARNVLLTHWFDKTDASHLLFVDTDMGFEPQLIFEMIEFNKPVVGVVSPKRQLNLKQLSEAIAAEQPIEKAIASAHDYIVQRPSRRSTARNGFLQVDGCGVGILLILRSCVETMVHKLPDIVDEQPSGSLVQAEKSGRLIRAFDFLTIGGIRLSEDFSFCHHWREKCGGEIWVNISRPITHVGLQHFTARYADAPGAGIKVIETPISIIQHPLKVKNEGAS
jgi:hypothetical protein